jgi:disulfide bond formation protein DsbB
MTSRLLILLASAGSAAALLGAFAFQYIGGLAPCHLCILQRWPHAAAVLIGVVALVMNRGALARFLPIGGAIAAAVTAGYGVYHTGVERGWWAGPDTCTSGPIDGVSAEDLLGQIMAAPLIRCDEVAWSMAGLSMASWNAVLSTVLVLIWMAAFRKAGLERD